MAKEVFRLPREEPPKKDLSHRRWKVEFGLIYEGGGFVEWTSYYRTYLGARLSIFYNFHIDSYGGEVVLIDQHES